MRITKIFVKGLFGMFDHEIPLNQESRITIVHGPNGVGKTVLMQMVYAFFQYDYEYIAGLPFEHFHIAFLDGKTVTVKPRQADDYEDDSPTLLINCTDETGETLTPFVVSATVGSDLDKSIEKLNPSLAKVTMLWRTQYWLDYGRIDPDQLDDSDLDPIDIMIKLAVHAEVYSRADLLRKYPSLLAEAYGEPPSWFASLQSDTRPQLIATARLSHEFEKHELAMSYLLTAARVARRSEGNPYRFVFPGSHDAVKDVAMDYRIPVDYFYTLKQMQENEQLMTELADALSEDAVIRSETVTSLLEDHYSELDLDRAQLESDSNYLRVSHFLDIINERLLFKTLRFNDEEELEFVADDGAIVTHSNLSSGEQHILVLYHQLLFETEPDTLVMIDEPEISMNVVWQRNFLKDLERIVELRKFDVLIATHSPQIVHDKWDWVVHLGAKADD